MSHVDEGLIHAWLDGALLPDDPERVQLEAHLAECDECRGRADAEREVRDRAVGILGTVVPDAVRVEPFEQMIAARKAARAAAEKDAKEAEPVPGKVDAATPITDAPHRRRRMVPLAWAATLVMAVTAGWFARSMMPMQSAPMESAADLEMAEGAVQEQPAVASPVPEEEANRPQPAVQVPGAREGQVAARSDVGSGAAVAGRMTFADTQAARTEADARARDPDAAVVRRSNEETRLLAEAITADEIQLDRITVTGAAAALVPETEPLDESSSAVLANVSTATWESVSEEEAATRLGRVPVRIGGLAVDSLQAAPHGESWLVRVVQRLESGEDAELLQWQEAVELSQVVVTGEAERKALGLQAAVADSAARGIARDSAGQRRERQAEVAPAAAPVPAEPMADSRAVLRLKSPGFRVLLRASVSSELLDSLAQRIR